MGFGLEALRVEDLMVITQLRVICSKFFLTISPSSWTGQLSA